MCFATRQMALFHIKPRVSLEATVLTKSKTPEGSADLEILYRANGRGFFAFRAGGNFSAKKMYLKKVIFSVKCT